MARIELVRSGGFAGLRLQAVVDTSADDSEGAWYAGQLAELDLSTLAAADSGGPAPDRYHYALSLDTDDGASHRLEFAEAALPEPLVPIVDRLVERALASRTPPPADQQ